MTGNGLYMLSQLSMVMTGRWVMTLLYPHYGKKTIWMCFRQECRQQMVDVPRRDVGDVGLPHGLPSGTFLRSY